MDSKQKKIDRSTKNQHFLSQVEQRLNSCNPLAEEKKQKIHAFEIADRESFKLKNVKGIKIQNNLSLDDLFSFDIVDKKIRSNFESIFNIYECKIKQYTESILTKLHNNDKNIEEELLYLFSSKLLNSFRNPFCIKKTLNTIGIGASLYPVDTENAEEYKKIIEGNKPHQKYTCELLEITKEEYQTWLKSLFMLLIRPKEGIPNVLEEMVKTLFTDKSYFTMVDVFHYTNEGILLSDRSYTVDDLNTNNMIFYFNLCSNAFIVYSFIDYKSLQIPQGFSQQRIDDYKNNMSNEVLVSFPEDDIKKFKEI